MSKRKKEGFIAAAVLAWAALHFYTSVRTFFENWYNTYTAWSWTFLGLWALGLLAMDVLLYFPEEGDAEPLRSVKWYWGAGTGLMAVSFAGVLADFRTVPGWIAIIFFILMFLVPANQLLAFSWLLFHQMAGLDGSALNRAGWFAGLLFCLIHFIYFVWLHRRARERGGTAHGPVGPGTGTVE